MHWFKRAVFWTVRSGVKGFMKLFLDYKIWGKDNIPRPGAKIYCSNHFSSTDPFFMITVMDEIVHMVIGPGFTIPVLKSFLKAGEQINALPDERKNVIANAVTFLEKDEAIYIFPEGELNNQKELLRFYPGIGKIYLEHPCPIVPIGIISPIRFVKERESDIDDGETIHKTLTVLSGKYYANIGEAMLFPNEEAMEDKKLAAEVITEKVKKRVQQLILDIKMRKFWE